jgi:hypothetical protein
MSLMNPGIDIQCDDCGTWRHTDYSKAAHARRALRAQGWVTRNEGVGYLRDYCPECRDKHQPNQPRNLP